MYVLGAGISGLTFGFLTGATVIGNVFSFNQMSTAFPLGPRILHADKWGYARVLLDKLGIYDSPKKFKIGFLGCIGFSDRDYILKTRGSFCNADGAVSGGLTEIVGWDMYEIQLYESLLQRVLLLDGEVSDINQVERMLRLTSGMRIKYDSLYSTIKLNTLIDLLGFTSLSGFLQAKSVKFILAEGGALAELLAANDCAYIYCSDHEVPFSRITKVDHGKYVLEIPEALFDSDWPPGLLYENKLGEVIVKDCQLVSKPPNRGDLESAIGITLVGRYSCWDHGLKLNDVIKEGLDVKKNSNSGTGH